MKQRSLVRDVELLLGSLRAVHIPDAEVRDLDVEFLVGITRRAAFGENSVGLVCDGAVLGIGALENVVREPTNLEARISRRPSVVRNRQQRDFFVEWWRGGERVAWGASTEFLVAIGNASRALATREE